MSPPLAEGTCQSYKYLKRERTSVPVLLIPLRGKVPACQSYTSLERERTSIPVLHIPRKGQDLCARFIHIYIRERTCAPVVLVSEEGGDLGTSHTSPQRGKCKCASLTHPQEGKGLECPFNSSLERETLADQITQLCSNSPVLAQQFKNLLTMDAFKLFSSIPSFSTVITMLVQVGKCKQTNKQLNSCRTPTTTCWTVLLA